VLAPLFETFGFKEKLVLLLVGAERIKKMTENKPDKKRILSYVNGLLYFYGVSYSPCLLPPLI
jgi:hypothetical protein